MYLTRCEIKNIRCVEKFLHDFSAPITLIEGDNGSGKTSLLEALSYACYLRSFRATHPREMIRFGSTAAVIKLTLQDQFQAGELHDIQIGVSEDKRTVKCDNATVTTYKELTDLYRVISFTEDDLNLVQGYPETRRLFLDQLVSIKIPQAAQAFRHYRLITKQRNALLMQPAYDVASFNLWTEQLLEAATQIRAWRTQILAELEEETLGLIRAHFNEEVQLALQYSVNDVIDYDRERRARRSLCGSHLDDIVFLFHDKGSRKFASRGQQKLIVVLLKVAARVLLGGKALFLCDDFMTDFDEQRVKTLLRLLVDHQSHLIITSPTRNVLLHDALASYNYETVILKNGSVF